MCPPPSRNRKVCPMEMLVVAEKLLVRIIINSIAPMGVLMLKINPTKRNGLVSTLAGPTRRADDIRLSKI